MTFDNWKLDSPDELEIDLVECENCSLDVEEVEKIGHLEVCENCAKELEEAQKEANEMFNPLWNFKLKTNKNISKIPAVMSARRWLAKKMNISNVQKCIIEKFTVDQCNEVINIIDDLYSKNKTLREFYKSGMVRNEQLTVTS